MTCEQLHYCSASNRRELIGFRQLFCSFVYVSPKLKAETATSLIELFLLFASLGKRSWDQHRRQVWHRSTPELDTIPDLEVDPFSTISTVGSVSESVVVEVVVSDTELPDY